MTLQERRLLQPLSSWLWPLGLCSGVAGLVLLAPSKQLAVGVVAALLLGCVVAVRERRLRSLCLTDSLTGLANRRGFLLRFERDLALARRRGQSMALLLVDCDHFKEINDRYGHPTGDWALKVLAHILRGAVRRNDVVARWGGDEFVVLLREVDDAEVQRVMDRVLQVLEPADPASLSFTVSVGCVLSDPARVRTARLNGLFSAADQALYLAKRRGGAQLASWSDAAGSVDFDQHTPPLPAGGPLSS